MFVAVFPSRDLSLTVLVVSVILKLFSLLCVCLFFILYFILFIVCTFELLIKECMVTILEGSTLGKCFIMKVVHNEVCSSVFSPFPHNEEQRPRFTLPSAEGSSPAPSRDDPVLLMRCSCSPLLKQVSPSAMCDFASVPAVLIQRHGLCFYGDT